MNDTIQEAFLRALAAIDDAMRLVRDLQERVAQLPTARVDTLSTSLADPKLTGGAR